MLPQPGPDEAVVTGKRGTLHDICCTSECLSTVEGFGKNADAVVSPLLEENDEGLRQCSLDTVGAAASKL